MLAFWIGICLLFRLPAFADSRCEILLHEVTVNLKKQTPDFSEEWTRLFVREIADQSGDTDAQFYFNTYVRYASESIFDDFVPWFENKKISSYKEMLEEMHRTLIIGSQKKAEGYQIANDPGILNTFGPTARNDVYRGLNNGHRGRLFEFKDDEFRKGTQGLRFDGNNLMRMYAWLGDEKFTIQKVLMPFEITNPRAWPKNTLNDGTPDFCYHEYPDGQYLDEYAHAAENTLEHIRDHFTNLSNEDLIASVAQYYYIAVNAHFFNRVNNSLLMSQVNYLLIKKGLPGLSHGYFDFLANMTDFKSFHRIFKNKILSQSL